MNYRIDIQQTALRDLERLSPEIARNVLAKIAAMRDGLTGNVKRLRQFGIDYRLRVGDYRVLFDLIADTIIVRRVLHRSKAYD